MRVPPPAARRSNSNHSCMENTSRQLLVVWRLRWSCKGRCEGASLNLHSSTTWFPKGPTSFVLRVVDMTSLTDDHFAKAITVEPSGFGEGTYQSSIAAHSLFPLKERIILSTQAKEQRLNRFGSCCRVTKETPIICSAPTGCPRAKALAWCTSPWLANEGLSSFCMLLHAADAKTEVQNLGRELSKAARFQTGAFGVRLLEIQNLVPGMGDKQPIKRNPKWIPHLAPACPEAV